MKDQREYLQGWIHKAESDRKVDDFYYPTRSEMNNASKMALATYEFVVNKLKQRGFIP